MEIPMEIPNSLEMETKRMFFKMWKWISSLLLNLTSKYQYASYMFV